jgi:fluoroquinolone resistance protein
MTDFPNSPSDSLNGRWSASVTDAVNGQLLRGLPNGSPFGLTPDGYADLRGLEIKVAVKQVNLRRVDFSGCCKSWAGQFGFCTLHDCLFSGSVLPTNFGSDFQRCKFTEAKLKGAVLRGRFEECDFSGADMASSLGDNLIFEKCSFAGANMRKVHFTGSRFVACRFEGARFASGSFARSVFVSCDLKLEWLGNTVVEKVSIS